MSGALQIAVATLLALGLGACDQRPSAERAGRNVDRSVSDAGRQIQDADKTAERKTGEAGKAIDDASVTAKVKSALITEPDLKARDIDVDTTDGVVTLQGTAETAESRQKAAQVASNIEGVKAVKNQIVVRGS
jgi:hyperosmotically inducible protein